MAFSFGFFNSINQDRSYDAVQMASIFDGIIRDGVFMHIGTSMMVKSGSGMMVNIGIGRAWFNHTWSLNDALYPVTLDQSEVIQDRIDLIVLEINSSLPVRANSYKVIKGTPSTNPVQPTLIKSSLINQYALAAVRVNRGVTTIDQANIQNLVGLTETPFVTGPLTLMNIDSLVAQWGDEWRYFYDTQTSYVTSTTEALLLEWHDFYNTQIADITGQNLLWRNQWRQWYDVETNNATAEMINWQNDRESQFNTWFESLQIILDGDVAANLASSVLDLQNRMLIVEDLKDKLSNQFEVLVLHSIDDSDGNNILDSANNALEGRLKLTLELA